VTTWANINLQDRASPIIEQLISFHDHSLMIILIIITVVAYIIGILIINKNIKRFMLEGQIIEVAWTIAPAIILVFIAVPSLRLLYRVFHDFRA
jgi:cytochrome c oxidase subunit 2